MEHPEDYKLRKRYEADRASGIAPGSMAQWMNDTAFKGLTTKLEAPRERIIAQVEGERRKEPHTYGDFIREIAKATVILQMMRRRSRSLGIILRPE